MKKSILLSLLFFCFSAAVHADTTVRGVEPDSLEDEMAEAARPQRRQLFDLWTVLFMGGCPPGPLGHHCRHPHHNSGGSSGNNYSGGGGSSSASSYGYDSSSGGGGSSSSTRGVNGVFNSGKTAAASWMLLVAVAAAGVAAMAIMFGQKKRMPEAHPLTGSVARRAALFGAFADSTLCADRPSAVEMTASYEGQSALV